MSKGFNQLRTGVVLNYINMALGMLIPFFYTPVMLKMLGQAEYGLYSLSGSVVSYLSLLSFGFGTTIERYIAKYRAENDMEKLRRTYGFFLMLFCGLAVLVLIFGLILANNVEPIFHKGLTGEEQIKMRSLVLIMTVSTAISFPMSVVTSMIASYERFIFRTGLAIIFTFLAPLASLVALWLGYQSVGMATASLAVQLIGLPWNIIYCRKKLKLKPKYGKLPKDLIREMVVVSFYNFLGTVVNMLFWETDVFILGMLCSTVMVAIYNVGATFNSIITNMSLAISGVLAPRITGMVVKNASNEELTELFIRIGRIQFLILGLVASGFVAFGQNFIIIWAGKDYADSYVIALLIMLPCCIPLIQNTGLAILVAQNKQKFRSLTFLVIAILNAVSTYLVVPSMGAIGAALCSCASYTLGQGVVMNIYYHKVTGIDIPKFWKIIIKMSPILVVLMVASFVIKHFININSWVPFFIGVFLYTVVYILLEWKFVMNDYEKDIVRGPVSNLLNKFKRNNQQNR